MALPRGFCSDLPTNHKRKKYRHGSRDTAVTVYTINQESRHLVVYNVPAIGVEDELMAVFRGVGDVENHEQIEVPQAEAFTNGYRIRYRKLCDARLAKKKLDNFSFLGHQLKVKYAPQFESINDTIFKLEERHRRVSKQLEQLGKLPLPASHSVPHNQISGQCTRAQQANQWTQSIPTTRVAQHHAACSTQWMQPNAAEMQSVSMFDTHASQVMDSFPPRMYQKQPPRLKQMHCLHQDNQGGMIAPDSRHDVWPSSLTGQNLGSTLHADWEETNCVAGHRHSSKDYHNHAVGQMVATQINTASSNGWLTRNMVTKTGPLQAPSTEAPNAGVLDVQPGQQSSMGQMTSMPVQMKPRRRI